MCIHPWFRSTSEPLVHSLQGDHFLRTSQAQQLVCNSQGRASCRLRSAARKQSVTGEPRKEEEGRQVGSGGSGLVAGSQLQEDLGDELFGRENSGAASSTERRLEQLELREPRGRGQEIGAWGQKSGGRGQEVGGQG